MEFIKRIFQHQKDSFVICLLFTAVLLPVVLSASITTVEPDPCSSQVSPCANRGTCVPAPDTDLGYTCICDWGYYPGGDGGSVEDDGELCSENWLLPCSYRLVVIRHGETHILDDCIKVTCDNSTIKAEVKTCVVPQPCDSPVEFEGDGECCGYCPYYVPIYKINPGQLNSITEREINNIVFDLNLMINDKGVNVDGQGLWKLGLWVSNTGDGDGERHSYQEQVLTEEQASTKLHRTNIFDDFDFNIRNISYSLDGICSEMVFLCYEFNKGDNPAVQDPRLSFTVEGVAGKDDGTLAPQNLRGCTRFPNCEEGRSCTYVGATIPHRAEYIIDECITATCNDSTVQVEIRSCHAVSCSSPVKFEGECCTYCPYYVPIYEVNVRELNAITERKVNDIVFDLNININAEGLGVTGLNLWKLGMWGSGSADGDGERISYQEQVLTDDLSSTDLIRSTYFGGFDFIISNINYTLDGTGATCSEMEFLCYEFNKGDNPVPKVPRLEFTVEGVAGKDDLTSAPQNLRGCTRFSTCVTDKSVSENTVQACDNIPEGEENDFVFDIRVAVRSAGINERGQKSWNVNVLDVNVVTSGEKTVEIIGSVAETGIN